MPPLHGVVGCSLLFGVEDLCDQQQQGQFMGSQGHMQEIAHALGVHIDLHHVLCVERLCKLCSMKMASLLW